MQVKERFTRPPKFGEIEAMLGRGVREFVMPKSCARRMGKKSLRMISQRAGKISIESSRGRPIALDLKMIREVAELHSDNRTYRQIADITGIPKSTAHYLIKYAQRSKIRKGGKTIYINSAKKQP